MRAPSLRTAALILLAVDLLTIPVGIAVHTMRPRPVLVRPMVVDWQCIDHHVIQSVDDGNRSGLLASNTGVSC